MHLLKKKQKFQYKGRKAEFRACPRPPKGSIPQNFMWRTGEKPFGSRFLENSEDFFQIRALGTQRAEEKEMAVTMRNCSNRNRNF